MQPRRIVGAPVSLGCLVVLADGKLTLAVFSVVVSVFVIDRHETKVMNLLCCRETEVLSR